MINYKNIKKGDKFKFKDREGIFLTKPEYRTDISSGLFYADVEFEDGQIIKNFMICLFGLEVKK